VNRSHDWFVAAVAIVVSLVANGMLLAYTFGKLEHRVEAVEQWRAELRAEWKEARERIEAALKGK